MRPEGGSITGCEILQFPNKTIAQCGRRRRTKDWPWDRFSGSPVRKMAPTAVQLGFLAGRRFFNSCGLSGRCCEVGGVDVVFPGNANQRE